MLRCSYDSSAEVSPQVLQMTSIFAWVGAEVRRSNNDHFYKSPNYFNAITPFKLTALFIYIRRIFRHHWPLRTTVI